MKLYNPARQRLYINAEERQRFLRATGAAAPQVQSLCLTLLLTGCRISEALALTTSAVQPDAQTITFQTLKRRKTGVFREVPVPARLMVLLAEVHALDMAMPHAPLWTHGDRPLNRVTAYRWVKSVMARADIIGAQACPKGLRHGYGIHAIKCGVPLNMVQKWLGHASMTTTAIYTNALGADELAIAERMWR
ncbi:tyrosine-type recombinase/integrase [Rhodophyticola porphyridii]|nr:site-specific integrase [Rhodophyticola porphyridii]